MFLVIRNEWFWMLVALGLIDDDMDVSDVDLPFSSPMFSASILALKMWVSDFQRWSFGCSWVFLKSCIAWNFEWWNDWWSVLKCLMMKFRIPLAWKFLSSTGMTLVWLDLVLFDVSLDLSVINSFNCYSFNISLESC